MSYVITYKGAGGEPRAISSYDEDERGMRTWCQALAEHMDLVVLYSLADNGLLAPVVQYKKTRTGKVQQRKIDATPAPRTQRVNETPTVAEAMNDLRDAAEQFMEATDNADETPESESAPGDDTEEMTYEGYCVKCKTKRAFVGHVEETKNGRRMAKGICPVCSTKVNALLPGQKHPEPEWHEEEKPEAPEADSPSPVSFSDAEEAHEDVPADLRDKAPAETHAKETPKKATPRKRAPRKTAKANNKADEESDQTAKVTATCPQCHTRQAVMNRAGLAIFREHENDKGERCKGSNTEVPGANR